MKHYITHVFNETIPSYGLKKLTFITITDDQTETLEYFLGTDNNPYTTDEINDWVIKGKIFALNGDLIPLPENQTLYFDRSGSIFMGDYIDPEKDKQLLHYTIENFVNQSAKVSYNVSIPIEELPVPEKFICFS